jgi:hypothetical protein
MSIDRNFRKAFVRRDENQDEDVAAKTCQHKQRLSMPEMTDKNHFAKSSFH